MHLTWRMIAASLLGCVITTALVTSSLDNTPQLVGLRIEGKGKTIFEGTVSTYGHNVTTALGGNHHCDGTNNGAHKEPSATVTSALADAAKEHGFTFDGPFFTSFDDFQITSIAGEAQTDKQFWGILLDFQETIGGCQQQVKTGEDILFAFDAFSKAHFLKLTGPETARVGQPIVFTATDGRSGAPISGADVVGQTSGLDGKVVVTFSKVGVNGVKATKSDSIRSNRVDVLVDAEYIWPALLRSFQFQISIKYWL